MGRTAVQYRLLKLHLKVTRYNDINEFGYKTLRSPGVRNPLFPGSHTAGSVASMQPAGLFGFYLKNGAGQPFMSTFAVFTQIPALPAKAGTTLTKYLTGVEDLPVRRRGRAAR